ncbi:MAG: SDR family oxidoreductase [bacterium]|uniref:UDP-glucose 4-epimerase (Galactowaldenase) (UDP-galactose 4-epimerase) (GalE-like) n=2 Tax=Bacteria candidate phyla TaxID=1783234 RepID=A0A117M759_UNCT6|nr:MAG: UDP-glucose 4-epimerase (Galactowaldenase) (UDP-galactose 4-epimerase) (GalE-like) [candidate division TA06 bacterium 32_111]KUK88104.1 MAG: UDP-glucose 4-epimerase (Galactowaldenase) (UDP-galactose 4-epimerase) (GalE-like) [candidate division TA06 bacterium 34_109]MDI6700905.1 SDR family oxidoreductase [bacterium]HAF07034.1 LPS biosynthesis protein WbpP [candidate division WOR-3 bacterium]HCP16949.1 LPS biosynthesis protein WbpP [candidate division WOR-3 bacterium]
MAKILVTGGAGFIGSNLVKALLEDNNEVRVLDNFSTGKRENILPFLNRIELVEGDIRSYHTVMLSLKDIDYVFHQAALPSVPRSINDPITTNDVNIVGTLNLLQCSKDMNIKRFIFASSSSIYGDNPIIPKVETLEPKPKSPYALTKLTGEYYSSIFYKIYGLKTISLRYFNVFGENQDPMSQYSAFIPKVFSSVKNKNFITIFGDGNQTRDFTYVSNVVHANILSLKASEEAFGEVFNVACGERISVNELVEYVSTITGYKIEKKYLPPRAGDVRDSMADIEKIKRIMKYDVLVRVKEGLKKSMEFYL